MFSYIDWYVSVSSLAIYHWFPFFAHFDVIAFEFGVGTTSQRLIIDYSRSKLIKIQLKPNISVDSNALKGHSVKNWNAGKISLRWKNFCFHNIAGDSAHWVALKVEGESTTHSSNVLHEKWKHSLRRLYIFTKNLFITVRVELSIVWQCRIRLLVNLFPCVLYLYCASFCSGKF